jgi:antitoxin HicB
MSKLHYSIVIEWSDEDQAYLVTLPEWAETNIMPVTHGDTYMEALKNGLEVLEMFVDYAQAHSEPLPAPKQHAA